MIEKVYIPPIKIQGIKTKLVKLISQAVSLKDQAVWYEPFMGSGVVGLNLAPKYAVFADTNPYVIALLEKEGGLLKEKDEKHYYYIRDRFNEQHNPLDFLFLNRSCLTE